MNPATAKALSLGVAVAVWATVSHLAKLPLQLWPVMVGLACFLAAGGGVAGMTKALVGVASGAGWAVLYVTVSGALGPNQIVNALVLGAAAFGMVFQSRIPLMGHSASAFAGAAVWLGTMGTRSATVQGGVRVLIMLAIGAGLGYGAEYLAVLVKSKKE